MSNEGLNLEEIDIDLSSDDIRAFGGGGGPMLPIGTYTMDIVSAERTTSKKNQPVAKVTFKVADEGDQLGVELPKSYSLQQQALGRIKKLMIAAGARLDKIRLGELVGARVIVEVIHTEASGQVDAQGNVMPGRMLCDITNEEAIAEPEAAPTPPPAVKGKAAPVQQAAVQPVQGAKNGSVARRA